MAKRLKPDIENSPGDPSPAPGAAAPRFSKWRAAILVVLLIGLAAAGVWWRRSSGSADTRNNGYNVLLITLDTTRIDCLGCYGNTQVRTPNINALAEGGTLFEQCISAAPMTLPSHASIMTGKFPFVHGARNNGRVLDDARNETLAERLRAEGYATSAEVAAYVLDPTWQINQGFDHYGYPSAPSGSALHIDTADVRISEPADKVCARALSWLQQRERTQPFFLWVHFFDPHIPWTAPQRLVESYGNSPIAGYLAEITFMDEQIGRLAGALRDDAVFDETIIVLATDHGEGLGQHQEVTHGYYIYDATMHAGLMIRAPGLVPANRRVAAQVRTVDIAPTILDLLGLPALNDTAGRSLTGMILDPEKPADIPPAYGESVVAFEWVGYAPLRFLREAGWKYIHAPVPELYAITQDPQEQTNRANAEPERVEAMRAELEALIEEAPQSPIDSDGPVQVSAEAANKLAALGYVGGYVPAVAAGGVPFDVSALPDPKAHVDFHHRVIFAVDRGNLGDHQGASAQLSQLAQEEPDNPAVLSSLGLELHRAGRHAEAADAWRRLLELQPNNAHAHQGLGAALARLGENQQAAAELRLAAEGMADFPRAWADLGAVLMSAKEHNPAVEAFRRASKLDPADPDIASEYSAALSANNQDAEAVTVLREAVAQSPQNPSLLNNLAWLLATHPSDAIRRPDEAVTLAQAAAKALGEPDPAAMDTLAAALAAAGRFDEAVATAEQAEAAATAAGQEAFADKLRARLELYRAGQPYRVPAADSVE